MILVESRECFWIFELNSAESFVLNEELNVSCFLKRYPLSVTLFFFLKIFTHQSAIICLFSPRFFSYTSQFAMRHNWLPTDTVDFSKPDMMMS